MSFKLPFKSPTLAVIALCSLGSACGEEHKSTHPQAQAPEAAEKLVEAEPARKTPDMPLTATAPATPRSILGAMKSGAVSELESSEQGPSVQEQKGEAESSKVVGGSDGQTKPGPVAVSPEQVKIDRFVLATDVVQREPVGESERFTTETPKIFAFMQFANEQAPFAVKVYWEKVSDPASPYGVELMVPTAARHRTWSWTKIRREPGTYRAVVRTLDGQELASKEFTIDAPSQQSAE